MINEEFLHFIWKFQLFDCSNLKSTQNHVLQILNKGYHNQNAGPDFLNAKIKIGTILWCGHIEIHTKSSQWYSHKHHHDDNYDTVILHVVYEKDVDVQSGRGTSLFCLELKGLIPEKYMTEYDSLYHSISNLPCSYGIGKLDDFFWFSYSQRLLVERLEIKAAQVRQIFLSANNDYQECFYRLLAYSLGLKINKEPMLNLAEITPLLMLQKHRSNRLQIEALLYGQSGLLNRKYVDLYPKKLQKEYSFYLKKYKLSPMPYIKWKFFRLRPNSFPSLRISNLADFVYKSEYLFEKLFNFQNLKELLPFFNLNTSDYWKSHYVFDKKSKKINRHLGKSTIDLLLINTILPFSFFYAKVKSDESMIMRVIDAYEDIKYENNKIIRYYKDAGVKVGSAKSSQAFIHLHQNYCIPRNCLNCRVFNQLLKK